MHIEKLENNKIKISLTEMDFIHFDINREELVMNKTVLHSFIMRLMDKISEETDFDPYSGNILVRAVHSQDGMNIIVSKVGEKVKYTKDEFKRAKSIKGKLKKEKQCRSDSYVTYFFSDFENLCTALKLLDDEFLKPARIYKYENSYALVACIDDCVEKQEFCFENISVLKEYSDRYTSGKVCAIHIKEQGVLVAESEKLLNMANGIREL